MTESLLLAGALTALVIFHGAAAGIRASAGRDGRVDHRRAERVGARRGILTALALVVPVAIAGALDASISTERFEVYRQAAFAFAVVAGPVAAVAAAAFGVALVASWQVRAFMNTVVIGGLEFARPAVAALAVIAVWWATTDAMVTVLAGLATALALLTYRVIARVWYSRPAALPPLTPSPGGPA